MLLANVAAFGSLVVQGLNGSKSSTENEYTLSAHDMWAHLSIILDAILQTNITRRKKSTFTNQH